MKRTALTLALLIATVLITWRITILSLQISVNEDTAYITSFGQTDAFDYVPMWNE